MTFSLHSSDKPSDPQPAQASDQSKSSHFLSKFHLKSDTDTALAQSPVNLEKADSKSHSLFHHSDDQSSHHLSNPFSSKDKDKDHEKSSSHLLSFGKKDHDVKKEHEGIAGHLLHPDIKHVHSDGDHPASLYFELVGYNGKPHTTGPEHSEAVKKLCLVKPFKYEDKKTLHGLGNLEGRFKSDENHFKSDAAQDEVIKIFEAATGSKYKLLRKKTPNTDPNVGVISVLEPPMKTVNDHREVVILLKVKVEYPKEVPLTEYDVVGEKDDWKLHKLPHNEHDSSQNPSSDAAVCIRSAELHRVILTGKVLGSTHLTAMLSFPGIKDKSEDRPRKPHDAKPHKTTTGGAQSGNTKEHGAHPANTKEHKDHASTKEKSTKDHASTKEHSSKDHATKEHKATKEKTATQKDSGKDHHDSKGHHESSHSKSTTGEKKKVETKKVETKKVELK